MKWSSVEKEDDEEAPVYIVGGGLGLHLRLEEEVGVQRFVYFRTSWCFHVLNLLYSSVSCRGGCAWLMSSGFMFVLFGVYRK